MKPKKAKPEKLPRRVFVGELVRLKEKRRYAYEQACIEAGWDAFQAAGAWEVHRIDNWPGNSTRRLWIDSPPHMLGERDVEFVYKSDNERRKRLKDLGVEL